MENVSKNDVRVEALCKRMGRMWSEKVTKNLEGAGASDNSKDGSLTLIGKLLHNPRINFQAFQQTMKKVWRVENSEFIPLDDGIFAVTFAKENEMRRIQEQGPWSFANHLLLLQSWRPGTNAVAYKFASCMFWIHVMGVPFEWGNTNVLRELVSEIGVVHDAKMETKGMATYGRVRVQMNLDKPLQSGILACNGEKKVWLDFKYERLPKFCYFCGRIGHYIAECNECTHTEGDLMADDVRLFGPWLKAEDAGRSPFWKLFYEDVPAVGMEDDRELLNAGQLVLYAAEGGVASSSDSGLENMVGNPGSPCQSVMGTVTEEVKSGCGMLETMGGHNDSLMDLELCRGAKKINSCGKRAFQRKKVRRFCPYDSMEGSTSMENEERLIETTIQIQEYSGKWALVAGPNKPPESQ